VAAVPSPVVLLHALPFDGRMWRAEGEWLPARTFAPTLYPLGTSLEAWAQGVLAGAPDEPFVVVGCSVGGSCALEVARAAPERVLGIVLIGAKAGVRPDPALRDEACRLLTDHGLDAAWHRYWRPLFGSGTAPGTLQRARALALDQRVDDVVRGVRAFHDRRDLTGFVRAWTRPLAVISGDQDRTPSPATAARAAAGPGRRVHLVADCGHYVNIERPAELRSILAGTLRWIEERRVTPARRRSRPGAPS
jgi:pimeloyl-[acyl-carrier protein] methyl ester esterase